MRLGKHATKSQSSTAVASFCWPACFFSTLRVSDYQGSSVLAGFFYPLHDRAQSQEPVGSFLHTKIQESYQVVCPTFRSGNTFLLPTVFRNLVHPYPSNTDAQVKLAWNLSNCQDILKEQLHKCRRPGRERTCNPTNTSSNACTFIEGSDQVLTNL